MGTLHPIKAQDTPTGSRTPEQEAAKQTEKYQKELKLTEQQAKLIYEINLKYARERQQSNNRTEAVSRIRKKSEEIKRVLSEKQNDDLQNKRLETQSVEIDGRRNFTRTRGAVRQSEGSSARSTDRTEPNSYSNRPVRQNRVSPSTRQSTSQERVNSTSRPVRENYRPDRERQTPTTRSSSSSTMRERNTSVREQRSSNNPEVRSSRSREQRQSSSTSRSSGRSSQPTRQSSGSRR